MSAEIVFEDFTNDSRTIIERATDEAQKHGSAVVEPVHLLLALLETKNNILDTMLKRVSVDRTQLRRYVSDAFPYTADKGLTPNTDSGQRKPILTEHGHEIIRAAMKEATLLGHRRVDPLHLLLGLLYNPEQPTHKLLTDAGLNLPDLRSYALQLKSQFRTRPRHDLRAVVRPSPVFLALVSVMVLSGGALWFNPSESLVNVYTTAFVLSGWIVSVCIHEFGHALAAHLGGDTDVAEAGYLSLNPLRYTHPVLSILLPLVYLLLGGLGLPGGAVYIRPGALRSRKWEILVAAAGPLGTLAFLLLIAWPFLLPNDMLWLLWSEENYYFFPALAVLCLFQVSALVLNLLPIPPLDGFGIIGPLLPYTIQQQATALGSRLFFILMITMWRIEPINTLFWDTVFRIIWFFHIPPDLAYEGLMQFLWWQSWS